MNCSLGHTAVRVGPDPTTRGTGHDLNPQGAGGRSLVQSAGGTCPALDPICRPGWSHCLPASHKAGISSVQTLIKQPRPRRTEIKQSCHHAHAARLHRYPLPGQGSGCSAQASVAMALCADPAMPSR